MVKSTSDSLEQFARTTEEIFSLQELERLLDSGRQLRIKYGVDLTAPYLHIGHAVNLWMMRILQDLGHKVQFLIGDTTTRIGDPTGRNVSRPVLSLEEIEANAQAFMAQAQMVLRFDDPELYEIRRNSELLQRLRQESMEKRNRARVWGIISVWDIVHVISSGV
jgi:tyrosyl-tRNA synthetase